jgi:hypothetical protein
MTIVHQPISSSPSSYLLLSAPKIAGLLPAVTATSRAESSDPAALRRTHLDSIAQPLFDIAAQYLEDTANDSAVIAAIARFYSQLVNLKGGIDSQPTPPNIIYRQFRKHRTKEEMDAEIAAMVAASRERLQNDPRFRSFFS